MALKKSQKSLRKWTKQNWGYVTKGDAKKPRRKRGRYLAESVRKGLSKSQKAYENSLKRAASKRGRQRARYSKRTRSKVRSAR